MWVEGGAKQTHFLQNAQAVIVVLVGSVVVSKQTCFAASQDT
jgi:hypothetical protein